MKRISACILLIFACLPAWADIVVPTRTLRARHIVQSSDLTVQPGDALGALDDPRKIVGQEVRATLYAGRPVTQADFGPPALIERNDLVVLVFRQTGLTISTEGRALGRGAPGERIRAMNLASRTTVSGRISRNGNIEVE